MVWLMLESEIFNVCVFFWLIFSLNCAVFFRLLGRTLIKLVGCCVVILSNWLRVWVRVSWFSLVWLINLKSKFVVVFSLIMVGILNGMIKSSRILFNFILVRWIIVFVLFSLLLRFFYGFRLTKVISAFCVWSLKLKSLIVKIFLTFVFSFFR